MSVLNQLRSVKKKTPASRRRRRGMALIMVLAALTVLTVMLTEIQDESSAELGSALSARDAVVAEYAAKSALNLSRLLIAAEPTIRQGIAPLFMMMGGTPPQIPVWQFADQVLGAFNDTSGGDAFLALAGVDPKLGKNLGFEGAGFEVKIIDEDSKLNVNAPARGSSTHNQRIAQQIMGLIGPPQYDPLFSSRDGDGQFSDRQAICAAIIDWTDPDQDADPCNPFSDGAQQAGAEDAFYEGLKKPYSRKNAAFDSIEELHRVRGMSEDFWSTFVDPEPDNPDKRTLTVWGQVGINVNTANPQVILLLVCSGAPDAAVCNDLNEGAKFLGLMAMLRAATPGVPIFRSGKQFVAVLEQKEKALAGLGPLGPMIPQLGIQPIVFRSADMVSQAIVTESKIFSVYATGYVRAGKRETRIRLHAVVDFRGAPAPGLVTPPPEGNTINTATGAAGNIIYYRVD